MATNRRSRAQAEPVQSEEGGEVVQLPARGGIGMAHYEAVKALVAGGMTVKDATVKRGEESSTAPATVATAYYREARKQGDPQVQAQGGRRRRQAQAGTRVQAQRLEVPADMAEAVGELDRVMRERRQLDQTMVEIVAKILDWHVKAEDRIKNDRTGLEEQQAKAAQLRDALAALGVL